MTAPRDLEQVAVVLREQVLVLFAQASCPPAAVRMAAAGVSVEVDWTAPAAPIAVAAPGVPEPVAAPGEPEPDTFSLCAETVGVFYRAPEPGAAPFVSEGEPVHPGLQVGIVEAMKLMIPVTASRAGRVVEFLVGDGTAVEFGQPLLLLRS